MKKFLTYVSLGVILVALVCSGITMGWMPRTYEPANGTSVYDLQQDPSSYDEYYVNGAADVIVQENLAKTQAVNDVTSIVFDFRGYDTMGEAFILITAVAGSIVILSEHKKKEEKEAEEKK